jgi:hypothetical protein
VFPTTFSSASARRLLSYARLGLTSVFTSLALTTASAPPAQAALISSGACNEAALSQPFLRWSDPSYYALLPGGNFEGSTSGWTLSGSAKKVAGSEPYAATGSLGAYSLSLPAGSSGQSPFTCVNASYPTFRFFARNEGLASIVLVQVLYKTPLGTSSASLGTVALSGTWQPTLPMLTNSIVGGVLYGGAGQVALRFTAVTGASRIDDVFLDPRMH